MIPQIPSLSCLPFFLYDPLFYNPHAFFFYLYNRHTYQVSSLCALPLRSLRREEVNWKKSAWDYLLLCIVVFLITYTKFGNLITLTHVCRCLGHICLKKKKSGVPIWRYGAENGVITKITASMGEFQASALVAFPVHGLLRFLLWQRRIDFDYRATATAHKKSAHACAKCMTIVSSQCL